MLMQSIWALKITSLKPQLFSSINHSLTGIMISLSDYTFGGILLLRDLNMMNLYDVEACRLIDNSWSPALSIP